jgi:hypothetical protein
MSFIIIVIQIRQLLLLPAACLTSPFLGNGVKLKEYYISILPKLLSYESIAVLITVSGEII